MPWQPLTAQQITSKFAPYELSALTALAQTPGSPNPNVGLASILPVVIRKWIGAMNAANYPVKNDGSVPDQLRMDIVAEAVMVWIGDFPRLGPIFSTPERNKLADKAAKVFESICQKTYGAIESPFGTDTTTANWNSAPKIIGRMAPIPPPALQMQQVPTPLYANPNAPADTVPINGGLPLAPNGFAGVAGNGKVTLEWTQGDGATSYNIYRSIASNQETLLVTVYTLTYVDAAVVNGTAYYYKIAAVNPSGTSAFALNEVVVTPAATGTP